VTRSYTGYNGDNGAVTPGLARFVQYCTFLTSNGLWNNGMYANRHMRGKAAPSVHATGRAVDLSWRRMTGKTNPRGFGNHDQAHTFIEFLVANADLLQLELVIDYYPKRFGAGWRCDRGVWQHYDRPTVTGGGTGDWYHLEIAPRAAHNPAYYDAAFASLFNAKA
jgi:hypothetical protein